MKKVLIVIGIVLVVGGVAGFLFWQDLKNGVQNDGKLAPVGQEFPDEGREHVPVGTKVEYKTNPPTSGNHNPDPANWGVYQTTQPDTQLVHNLEHGGIWISYQPGIDADTKAKLEAIGREHSGSVIVEPRADDPAKICVTSWRRMITMDTFDHDKIEEFIAHNINNSPEPLAKTFNM